MFFYVIMMSNRPKIEISTTTYSAMNPTMFDDLVGKRLPNNLMRHGQPRDIRTDPLSKPEEWTSRKTDLEIST